MKISGLISKTQSPDPAVVKAMRNSTPMLVGVGGVGSREIKDDTVLKLPLSQVDRSPYQVRTMGSKEKIELLAQSIRANGQSTPIIVRPIGDDDTIPADFDKDNGVAVIANGKVCTRFELIAGEHRLEACRLLGSPSINAVVRLVDDRQAAVFVATDNAHNHPLCDYDRYLQAKMLRDQDCCKTNSEIAPIIGIANRTTMSQLWSYDALPEAAHGILKANHDLVGINAMYRIRDFCYSHPDLVTDAICRVAQGSLVQTSLPAFLEKQAALTDQKEGEGVKLPAERKLSIQREGFPEVKISCNAKQAKIVGSNIDPDRLAKLIEDNLESLFLPAN